MLRVFPYQPPEKVFSIFKDRNGAALFLSAIKRDSQIKIKQGQETERKRTSWSILAFDPVKQYWKTDTSFLSRAEQDWKRVRSGLSVEKMNRVAPYRLPFIGGILGLLSYDLAGCLEVLPDLVGEFKNWPDLALGLYDSAICFDIENQKSIAFSWGGFEQQEVKNRIKAEQFFHQVETAFHSFPSKPYKSKKQDIESTVVRSSSGSSLKNPVFRKRTSKEKYLKALNKTLEYIHDGDIFQANISQGFSFSLAEPYQPYDIFTRLVQKSPAPFSACFRLNDTHQVLTHSPERFFSVDREGMIETRPIKGTRPRSPHPEKDEALKQELKNSEKDKAENLMIVDLMRNDLSRVSVAGSVEVPQLFVLESYQNVHHLVSVVRGKLKPDYSPFDVLRACFPAGSITGAPKIRAMEIISEMEEVKRHAYCGSLGYISLNGCADFNVMIRSLSFEKELLSSRQEKTALWRGIVRSGGGIVADSQAEEEYQETIVKASAIQAVLEDL